MYLEILPSLLTLGSASAMALQYKGKDKRTIANPGEVTVIVAGGAGKVKRFLKQRTVIKLIAQDHLDYTDMFVRHQEKIHARRTRGC